MPGIKSVLNRMRETTQKWREEREANRAREAETRRLEKESYYRGLRQGRVRGAYQRGYREGKARAARTRSGVLGALEAVNAGTDRAAEFLMPGITKRKKR